VDVLDRARALAACPLFADLAPAVLIRLAERAHASELEAGERRTTEGDVLVIADGAMVVVARPADGADATASVMKRTGGRATAGSVLGLVRVVAPNTPLVAAIAERPTTLVALAIDDVRDVLEEDPAALAALAAALARLLLEAA
jgi:CRP-like cAMP-binding protein